MELIDPSDQPSLQAELRQRFGFEPLPVGMFSEDTFWSFITVQRGEQVIPAPLLPEFIISQTNGSENTTISAGDIQSLIESFIKRMTPGFRKSVGLITKKFGEDAPSYPAPQAPNRDFNELQTSCKTFDVELLDLSSGTISSSVDVVVIAKP